MRYFYILFFFFLPPHLYAQTASASAYEIDTIIFRGLEVSQEEWIRTFIKCREGENFSTAVYERDLQSLRNLNLFFSVTGEWDVSRDVVSITIVIKEANYLYPYVYIGGFREAFQLALGLNHIHWEGRGASLGVWYRYYDRHSISAYYRMPRFSQRNWGYEIALGKYGTVEPLYFEDQVCLVNYDLYSAFSKYIRWIGLTRHLETGLGVFHERYSAYDPHPIDILARPFNKNKGLISMAYIWDKRDYSYEMVEGNYVALEGEYIYTVEEPQFPFSSIELTWKNYSRWKEGGNLAMRIALKYGTNRNSPFLPFIIDGFANVRGSGNRVARGTALALYNIEYRKRVFWNAYGIVQVVAFGDVAWLREAGSSISDWWRANSNYSYVGVGGRITLQKWYHTILRLDYSYGLRTSGAAPGGWVFGVGQFF